MNYITEITGWTIKLDNNYFYLIESNIRTNKPITPEVVGHLIGMAESVVENVKCTVCKKDILKEEQTTNPGIGDFQYQLKPATTHQKCYDKEHEKWLKQNKEVSYE